MGTAYTQLMNNIPADYNPPSRLEFGPTLDMEICEGLSKPNI